MNFALKEPTREGYYVIRYMDDDNKLVETTVRLWADGVEEILSYELKRGGCSYTVSVPYYYKSLASPCNKIIEWSTRRVKKPLGYDKW